MHSEIAASLIDTFTGFLKLHYQNQLPSFSLLFRLHLFAAKTLGLCSGWILVILWNIICGNKLSRCLKADFQLPFQSGLHAETHRCSGTLSWTRWYFPERSRTHPAAHLSCWCQWSPPCPPPARSPHKTEPWCTHDLNETVAHAAFVFIKCVWDIYLSYLMYPTWGLCWRNQR